MKHLIPALEDMMASGFLLSKQQQAGQSGHLLHDSSHDEHGDSSSWSFDDTEEVSFPDGDPSTFGCPVKHGDVF